jgi:uncharacterized oxidoreductase
MDLKGNTILITGGSSGIGMAMAARFSELGNEVIVTGRRESALQAFKARYPAVVTKVNDAGDPRDRCALATWAAREFPRLNVLVNNAGIQRKVSLHKAEPWADTAQELDINLGGPIHLSALFVPQLEKQAKAQIMNVSSGLAFVPLAYMPVYCATKAALHSFTLSLREQLKATSIAVTEIIPPAVKTNLGGAHDFGEELSVYIDSVFAQLATDATEISFGFSGRTSQMSRADLDQAFQRMNGGASAPSTTPSASAPGQK